MTPVPAKPPLTGETPETLAARLRERGEPAFRAAQILDWLYKKHARSWDAMSNLPKPLRAWLAGTFDLLPATLVLARQSADITDKLLLELHDKSLVETVIIRAPQDGVGAGRSRRTVCLSTQVGCAMGCVFCASGLAGLRRNLTAGEIVAQYLRACHRGEAPAPGAPATDGGATAHVFSDEGRNLNANGVVSSSPGLATQSPTLGNDEKKLTTPTGLRPLPRFAGHNPVGVDDLYGTDTQGSPRGLGQPWAGGQNPVGVFLPTQKGCAAAPFDNIVVMGMGEPLANYDALMRALTIINAPWGAGVGARRITISTCGLVPQIHRLADEAPGFRLAVSLHGATDEVREKIMPVNKAHPLAKLLPAIRAFSEKHGRMATLEFILIENVNDSLAQAAALRDIALDLRAHVNLIPCNAVAGLPWKRPSRNRQERFADVLRAARAPVTLRREKGHDIDAACGQLRLKTGARENPVT